MGIPSLSIQTVTIPVADQDRAGVIAALRAGGVDVADAERQGWGIQTPFTDPDGNGFVLLQHGA